MELYPFENVSFLTLLKCIGMRNVEWRIHSTFHIPKFWNGNWNVDFHIPYSIFQCTLACLEWDILKRTIPHSTFQNSGMGIGMWNSTFQIPHSEFQTLGIWIGIGIGNSSTFQIPFHSYSHASSIVVVINLFTMLFNFKFHSDSTVDGMECGISVWYWVLLGASLCRPKCGCGTIYAISVPVNGLHHLLDLIVRMVRGCLCPATTLLVHPFPAPIDTQWPFTKTLETKCRLTVKSCTQKSCRASTSG